MLHHIGALCQQLALGPARRALGQQNGIALFGGGKAPDGLLAKGLLDKGYHAPTIYFPLIVKECLMFEPTETESKETLDQFAADLLDILATAKTNPEKVQAAPVTLPIRRLDETKAARNMILTQKD